MDIMMVAGCDKAIMLSAVTEERPYMHQNGGISPSCAPDVSGQLQAPVTLPS